MSDPVGITTAATNDTDTYACKGLVSELMGFAVHNMVVSILRFSADTGGPVQKGAV